jgi:CIC family chloride channel protein
VAGRGSEDHENTRLPRVRAPRPLIPHRVSSGRGATEQPNATGDGEAPLTLTFWLALVATAVATGLLGAAMMAILHNVQHLAFGYRAGVFESAVQAVPWSRRAIVLLVAGAIAGPAFWAVRRFLPGASEVHASLWDGRSDVAPARAIATSVLSEFVVGMGASLGREAAPQLLGGLSGSILGRRAGLLPEQRRLLLACGAGAGLAAVYNVPIGGALITAELLYGQITLPVVLPALAAAVVATATSWVYLPVQLTYVGLPHYGVATPQLVWALIAGLLIGLIAVGWTRLVAWTSAHALRAGPLAVVGPLVAFGLLAVAAGRYPQLLGNGKDLAHDAFVGSTLLFMLTLFVLKPLMTALCLGSGATGGLFTPTLSTGAVLGGALGILWSHLWPGSPSGAYAVIGAAAMTGAAMQAPLAAVVLAIEMTGAALPLAVPLAGATFLATLVARYVDGYSIYSGRLPPRRTPLVEDSRREPRPDVSRDPAPGD